MVASQARIDANRRNSLRSCGPKTAEGKTRSRANGLVHGLCSLTVVAESEELVRERTEAFITQFQPEGEYPLWLAGQAALASLRIERCQRMERGVRDKVAIRAEVCWGDDERLEAVRLGGSISRAPELMVEKLRQTLQGCEWLIGRWGWLADAADSKKFWTDEQADLALDLLGTPEEFREGKTPWASAESSAAFARGMIAELQSRRDLLSGLDEARQALAWADLDDESDPELKRIRRYETSLQRRLRWCVDQLENPEKAEAPPPPRKVKEARRAEPPPEIPEPEPVAEPASLTASDVDVLIAAGRFSHLNLPFCNQPLNEPTLDKFIEFPVMPSRADKKLEKADTRREAKQRKLEKARA
jgi:hypothetical protein